MTGNEGAMTNVRDRGMGTVAIATQKYDLATDALAKAFGGAHHGERGGAVALERNKAGGRCALPAPEGAARWYVVQCRSHRETLAVQELTKQGFLAFSPYRLKSRRHARKITTIRAPFFPGYAFVALDLTRDRWSCVNGTRGVSRLVAFGQLPAPVPDGLVEGLAERCDSDGIMDNAESLRIGQSVKVLAGPFAELIGTLERLSGGRRICVLLDILGARVPVVLGREFVGR